MSSTPLSGNAIRSPNGAPSLSNKTNPQLLDMRCAASQTRDQHTIVIWLILFVYMKIQRSVSPYCAATPDTMWCIIGCWLRKQKKSWWHPGLEWWIVKRGKKWIRVLVKYFFTSVLFALRTASSVSSWFSRLGVTTADLCTCVSTVSFHYTVSKCVSWEIWQLSCHINQTDSFWKSLPPPLLP